MEPTNLSSDWVIVTPIAEERVAKYARWKKIEHLDFSRQSPLTLLQIACYFHTGFKLPKDVAYMIMSMAHQIKPDASSGLFTKVRNLVVNLVVNPELELVKALKNGDWDAAWIASIDLCGRTVQCANEVFTFLVQKRVPEAEFLLLHTDEKAACKAVETIDNIPFLDVVERCFLNSRLNSKLLAKSLLKRRAELDPDNAEANWNYAKFVFEKEYTYLSNLSLARNYENLSEVCQVLKKAYQLYYDSRRRFDPILYYYLSYAADANGQVTLLDGRICLRSACVAGAIRCNSLDERFYLRLAWLLMPNQSIVINGKRETVQSLLEHALRCNPRAAQAFYLLGELTSNVDEKKVLLQKAIACNPQCGYYYYRLSSLIKDKEHKKRLLASTLSMPCEYAKEYHDAEIALIKLINDSEKVIIGGKKRQRSDLIESALKRKPNDVWLLYQYSFYQELQKWDALLTLRRCIEINPQYVIAWFRLGQILFDRCLTINGQEVEACSCFKKCISIDPNYAPAYLELSINLWFNSSTHTLPDGSVMTKQALILRAIALNPYGKKAYLMLADTMNSNESIALEDGRVLSKKDLQALASALD